MAKTVKINMYKFVDVEKQSASSGVGSQAEAENKLVSTINLNTMAINNIGSVLNGCVTTLVELKNIEEDRLEERRKDFCKLASKYAEEGKVYLINISRESIEKIKKLEK